MWRLASVGSLRAARAAPRRSCQDRCSMAGRISSAGLAALALNSGPSHSTIICSLSWNRRAPPRSVATSARAAAMRTPTTESNRSHGLRVEDLGPLIGHHVAQDVEVPDLAEPSPVPGQLGPERRCPTTGRRAGGRSAGWSGCDAWPPGSGGPARSSLVAALGAPSWTWWPTGPTAAGSDSRMVRASNVRHVVTTAGRQLLVHVVEQEGAGRLGQDPVEHHPGRGVGEEVVGRQPDLTDGRRVLAGSGPSSTSVRSPCPDLLVTA